MNHLLNYRNFVGLSAVVTLFMCFPSWSAAVWSCDEGQIRQQLVQLASDYEYGLSLVSRRQKILRQLPRDKVMREAAMQDLRQRWSYRTVEGLCNYLRSQSKFDLLCSKGEVLFVDPEQNSLKTNIPVVIHVPVDSSSFVRVSDHGKSNVRIVRWGTIAYSRIAQVAKVMESRENQAPIINQEVMTRPITLSFVDEDGKPLKGEFGLNEEQNGEFLSVWFRAMPVGESGTVELEDSPREFRLCFTSDDDLYTLQLRKHDLPKAPVSVVKIEPTGVIACTIQSYPRGTSGPVVAVCDRRINGRYVRTSGMGLSPKIGKTFVFRGLPDGIYRIQLKHRYGDEHLIAERDDVEVSKKMVMAIQIRCCP